MACGKRKQEAYLDTINTEEEKANEKDDWSFHSELEQLTLTDVSDEELEELVLSEIEQENGGIVVDKEFNSIDECLNMSLLRQQATTIQTNPNNPAK